MTNEVVKSLADLPPLEEITDWTKSLEAVKHFHFVNIYLYLVESRDKTFD